MPGKVGRPKKIVDPAVGVEKPQRGPKDRSHLWGPGQSGNPSGKPKQFLTQALREVMTPEKAEKLADKIMTMALNGDMKAIEMIYNRIDGSVVGRNEQGKPGEFDSLEGLRGLSTEELREIMRTKIGDAS
jgi:hypothetical protein